MNEVRMISFTGIKVEIDGITILYKEENQMAFTTLEEFKAFMLNLLAAIVQKGDSKAAEMQVQLDKLSADLSAANDLIASMSQDFDAVKQQQLRESLAELDTFAEALAESYNPTPVADAIIETVKESPELMTPDILLTDTTVGTGEATEPEVLDAALLAIGE